jgi:hypothetical protein
MEAIWIILAGVAYLATAHWFGTVMLTLLCLWVISALLEPYR